MHTYKTAKAIILDKNNKILLLRRSSTHPTEGLKYDLPGGIVEADEEIMPALYREIQEETGLDINNYHLKLVFTATEDRGDKVAFRYLYATQLSEEKPQVKLSWEHDEVLWSELQKTPRLLVEGKYTQKGLQFVLNHKLLE